MKKLNHITLEHVMQSLLSKKENELLNSIIQKLNWNIDDLNHLIDNINTQKDIIYFIVLGDWIKEACTEIYKLYEKYTNNFVYKENNSRKLANDKFKAIRSFIVAHPLNTSSHPNEGYNGSKKCIDIYMHIPTIAKFSRLYDNPNADFFMLMLSLAVMISICHAVVRLPGYLSWNVPFDGADNRPITKELSSCIHALPVL